MAQQFQQAFFPIFRPKPRILKDPAYIPHQKLIKKSFILFWNLKNQKARASDHSRERMRNRLRTRNTIARSSYFLIEYHYQLLRMDEIIKCSVLIMKSSMYIK